MKESRRKTKSDSREGRKKEREKKPRGKHRWPARGWGPDRGREDSEKNVENGVSLSPITDSPIPNGASTVPEAEVERPGRLTQKQIGAIQKAFRAGIEPERISELMGYGLSTVYRYTQGLEVVMLPETASPATPPSSPDQAEQAVSTVPEAILGEDHSERPVVPRLSSEVLARRPTIAETGDEGDYKSWTGQDNAHASSIDTRVLAHRPVSVMIRPDDPALQDIVIELLHLSASRGVPFGKYLSSGMAVEDLRNASFAATLVPGETNEEFRQNLLLIAKKANLHDRYRTDAGLDDTEVEQR
jgi:hypothetical protein